MVWLDKLIVLLTCSVEIYMFFDYFYNFFELKLRKRYAIMVCIGTVGIHFLVACQENSVVNLIMVPLTLWTFVTVLFDAKLGVRLGYFVSAFGVTIGVEFLYLALSKTTAEMLHQEGLLQGVDYIWQMIFIKLLNYIVFFIMKQTSSKSKKRMTNRLFWSYVCIPLTTIGTMLVIFYSGLNFDKSPAQRIIMTCFFVCMLLGNLLFFLAFQKYSENLDETHRQQVELVYQKAEIERLSQIAGLHESFDETMHNATHYLKVIGQLAYENKAQEISEIVEQLTGKMSRECIYEYSNHKMLNMVLSEYERKAKKEGIRFDAYVEPGSVLSHIPDIDLIAMFGNLLDNALRAASKKEEDSSITVRVFMQKNGHLCIMKVINDFTGELHIVNGKLLSTKKEAGVHGIGVASIAKTAERYGGYLEYYVEDNKFHAVLVFPISCSDS